MFTALREFTRSWWFKGILGLVVLSFVITFGYEGITSNGREIGVIQGKKITYNEYVQTYDNLYNSYSQLLKDNPEQRDVLLDPQRLRPEAVERLVEREILLIQAEKQGIIVPDDELADRIRGFFDRNAGGFTMRLYEGYLRSEKLSKKEFERRVREDLIQEKLQRLIKDGIQVSDQEVREAYTREKEQVRVEFALLSPSRFVDQVQTQEPEIEEFYRQSKEEFRQPARVKAEYLRFEPGAYEEKASVTEAELRAFYDEHADEYFRPHQVRARHLLLRVPERAEAEEEGQIRQKAETLLKEAEEGADFAQLAQQHSEDPGSASRGGDLGYFGKGLTLPAFEETAFSLKQGEVGGPVRTAFGFHLIKVEDIREAHHIPLAEVKEEVRQRLVQEETRRMARREAWKVRQAMLSGQRDFAQPAQEPGPIHGTTDFFTREAAAIQGVNSAAPFAAAAFSPALDGVSEPVETGEGYYLIQVAEKKASFVPPVEDVREEILERLAQKKSWEKASQKAQEIVDQVKKGEDWTSAVVQADLSPELSELFTRGGGPAASKGPDFIQTAFGLKEGEVKKVELPDGIYLLKLAARKGIEEKAFQEEKEETRERMLLQKRERVFRAWVANLVQAARQKGEVKINDDRLL